MSTSTVSSDSKETRTDQKDDFTPEQCFAEYGIFTRLPTTAD
jgi:hypothetical protein